VDKWRALLDPLVKLLHHFAPLISDGTTHTTDEVVEVIERGVISLPIAAHVKGDLRFSYTEQGNAEQFFTPYVFSLVYLHSGATFNAARISLFWLPGEISWSE
jgi:hypothetical protein